MPMFVVSRPKTALSTSNDLITIVPATYPLRIYFTKLAGAGTSSADNEVVLQRSTGGTTGGNAGGTPATVAKLNPSSAAATFSAYTTWSAQPTLTSGEVLHRFMVNANGGIDPDQAFPGGEIPVPLGSKISIRSVSGISSVVLNMKIEEIDG